MQQTMQHLCSVFGAGQPLAAAAEATADVPASEHYAAALPGNSSSNSNVTPVTLEEADQVLQTLGKQVWQLREVSRCLIYQYMNTLDPYQLSVAVIHSWPFIAQPPPVIEAVVKDLVKQQQDEEQKQVRQQQRRSRQQQQE